MAISPEDICFEADYGADYDKVSDLAFTLYTFAEKCKDRLPMDCRLFGDKQEFENIKGVSEGESVRVLRIVEKIHIAIVDDAEEDHYEVPAKRDSVELPEDYWGSFQIASNYPDGYQFETVDELAVDFPQFVLVQDELEIRSQGVFINPGDRLKLTAKGSNGSMQWIECKHIQSDTNMILPSDMTLKTVKKLDTQIYSARELFAAGRFPVKVKKASDLSTAIRGIDLSIPGIENDYDGNFVLYKKKYLEIESCASGENIHIQLSANLSVIPREIQCGELGSVHELAKKVVPGNEIFANLLGKESEALGLSEDSIVTLRTVQRECILVKGHSAALAIPKNFQGEFKLEGTRFQTPMDLMNSKFEGKVRATRTCIIEDVLRKYEMSDIFEFDVMKLLQPDSYESIALPDGDEVEVIELSRECSTRGKPGTVSVPGDIEVGFVASPPSLKSFPLLDIIHRGWMAQKVSFNSPTDSGLTTEDFLLVKESPLDLIGVHQYASTIVTEVDPQTGDAVITREIPEWDHIKARQLISGFPPCVRLDNVAPPRSSIRQLTSKIYEDILDQLVSADVAIYQDPNIDLPAGPSIRPSRPQPNIPPKPFNLNSFNPHAYDKREKLATPPRSRKPSNPHPYDKRDKLPTPPRSPNIADSRLYDRPRFRPTRDRERSYSENEVIQPRTETSFGDKVRSVSTEEKPSRVRNAFRTLRRSLSSKRLHLRLSLPDNSTGSYERSQTSMTDSTDIREVKPPANGDISHFTVEEIAGLMKHLVFSDRTVENVLTKNIDGNRLCAMNGMENDELKDSLRLQTDMQLFTVRHFIDKSTQSWTY